MAVDRVREVVEEEWAYLWGLLPTNLDELAIQTGALRRRRAVGSAHELLRLALAYAAEDWSLRQTAAMARAMNWHTMSDVAVLKRLRGCPEFLRRVISAVLARRLEVGPRPGLRVCLVDATTIGRPGGTGVDWRLHVGYDLGALQLQRIEVTDTSQGESLTRLDVDRDQVYVADRAYARNLGLLHLLQQGGTFIIRASLHLVRLRSEWGTSLGLIEWLRGLPEAQAAEHAVELPAGRQRWPLRLVAVRKEPDAAARAEARALQVSKRKGQQLRETTTELARYVVVLTNCSPELSPEQVLETYRFRWQVELAFKRLKSLLHLDQLRARDPELAQAYLLAKILAALLAEDLVIQASSFSPWGFRLIATPA